jgi:uncharacterized repeat protein (TIGR02543 family)
VLAAAAAVAWGLGACDAYFYDGAPPVSISLSVSLAVASPPLLQAGLAEEVFERVDAARVTIRAAGETLVDGQRSVTPVSEGLATAPIELAVPRSGSDLTIEATLLGDGMELFQGATAVRVEAGSDGSVTVPVELIDLPPDVVVLGPPDGTTVLEGTAVELSATADDRPEGDLTASIVWSSDRDGVLGSGGTVVVTLSVGRHTVTASVTDAGGQSDSQSIQIRVLDDPPPVVTISEPPDGTTVSEGSVVALVGSAVDDPDGDLTTSLRWTSDMDGLLGIGGAVDAVLSPGSHTVMAAATDSRGQTGSASVGVTVTGLSTLSVTVEGSGTVTSDPGGIDCPGDCQEGYDDGTAVTLTAAPAEGWAFVGWSGACSGTGGCEVTMDGDRSVTATFEESVVVTLSVTVEGGGSVTSEPAGITCPGDCEESYEEGTLVTLFAAPADGWTFAGWGGACSGSGGCSVTMNVARTVTATFEEEAPVLRPEESCSDYPDDAIATFLDLNLEGQVRSALSVGPTEDLTCGLLRTLTALTAVERGIVSLVGIQNLTGLTYLQLNGNSILSLEPLRDLTGLRNLYLQSNGLSDIRPLGVLENLTSLDLDDNEITDITALSGLRSIVSLDLQINQISDITPVSGLTTLVYLRFTRNSVSDLGALSSLSNLQYLWVDENSVSKIDPWAELGRLVYLALGGNSITDIGILSDLPGLEQLYLQSNSITDVGPLTGLTRLFDLYLDDNPLTNIDPLLENEGLGEGDVVSLVKTGASCDAVAVLKDRGVTVYSDCG